MRCPSVRLSVSVVSTIVEVFETIIHVATARTSCRHIPRVVFYITTMHFGIFHGTARFWVDFEVEKNANFSCILTTIVEVFETIQATALKSFRHIRPGASVTYRAPPQDRPTWVS